MNQRISLPTITTLILLAGLSACSTPPAAPTPQNTLPPATATAPPAVPSPTVPPPAPSQPPAEYADTIFYNGAVVTINEDQPLAQAIAVKAGLIQAVGSDEEVLALQGPGTVTVDLQGHALLPGFIDGHTHILAFPDRMGRTLAEAQQTALSYGFTGVTEMWSNDDFIGALMEAEQAGELRLRVNVFASYNDGTRDENLQKIFLKTWYPANGPILDPTRRLRIPGIKFFVDGDNANPSRGCWALSDPFMPGAPAIVNGVCGTDKGDLYWNQDELNRAVADAQAAGFRAAFHAMGDLAIETALNAIEFALDGQSNDLHRHQIEHNSLARPDLLLRYEALGVPGSVRGYVDICDPQTGIASFGPDRNTWYANRYALPGLDIHAYNETDFGWTVEPDDRLSQRSLDPLMHLFGMVTHKMVTEDGSTCDAADWAAAHVISVERALQMFTIDPAYAVSMEDYVGSLTSGKYADLIILSASPLAVAPADIMNLQVWMTMVEGKVEYCADGQEAFCPQP